MIIKQPSRIKKTLLDHIIEAKIYRKESEWWDEPNPSSYLPMESFLSA